MIRTNLVPNPTFKSGITGWTSTAGTTTSTIITSKRAGNVVTITTSAAHNLRTGYYVTVAGTNGNPSIEGSYTIASVPTSTTFTYVTTTSGVITEADDTGTASFVNLNAEIAGGKFDKFCLKAIRKAATNSGVYSGLIPGLTAGLVYSASAYVYVPTGESSGDFKIGVEFYNSSDVIIGSIHYSATTTITSASGWVRVSISYTAPALTTSAKIFIVQATSGTANKEFLVDGVLLENAAEPMEFIEPLDQGQENTKVNNTLRKVPVPHITGMELSADIMLNGLLLNTVDENDIVWVCTDLEGWWTLPDSEVPDLTRGLDDGSYDVRGRYTAREMTLSGSALLPNRDLVPIARAKLIDAIALVHRGGWLYVDEDPTKASFVRLSGKPDIEVVNPRGRIDFSIGLRAANPVKLKWNWNDIDGYESATVVVSPGVTVVNDGNIDTPVVFTIDAGSASLCDVFPITNSYNTQSLRVIKQLRGSAYSSNISSSSRSGTTVTLTSAGHKYLPGDIVTIAGVTTSGRTGLNEAAVTISSTTTNTVTYTTAGAGGTLGEASTNGAIGMDTGDVLEIDTYNKSATLNGDATYARSFIDAQVDWTVLGPGSNTVTLATTGTLPAITMKYRSGWIG